MSALDSLQVTSALSYLIAFGVPALDAILPALPSESAIVALGVATAGSTDPRVALLVILAAAGAFAGDNLSYLIGRRFGPAVQRRFFGTPKGIRAHAWAERSLDRFGMQLIIVCRFIPGGRTAVTLTCGLTGYPRRRFAAATALAAAIWATQAFLIGRIGGRAFADDPWAALAVALGASVAISALIEIVRRLWPRRMGGAAATDSASTDVADVGSANVGTANVGTANVGTADVGTANVGSADVGSADVGTANVGISDVGISDVDRADADVADTGVAEANGAEVADAFTTALESHEGPSGVGRTRSG